MEWIRKFYEEYKEYIRVDLLMYIIMFAITITVFVVLLVKK
jgi:hypothetical protein